MNARPKAMDFFRFKAEYLAAPKAQIAFWGSLVGGVVSLIAAVLLHGTSWERFEMATAAFGAFSLVDAALLRYLYEIKRESRFIREWLTSIDETTEE